MWCIIGVSERVGYSNKPGSPTPRQRTCGPSVAPAVNVIALYRVAVARLFDDAGCIGVAGATIVRDRISDYIIISGSGRVTCRAVLVPQINTDVIVGEGVILDH